MKTPCALAILLIFITACQKEISTELNDNEPPTDSAGVDAFYIKIEDVTNVYLEDSIVLRYGANNIDEVHYNEWVDSSVKTYLFDGSGKLIEINCPEGIFDPSGAAGGTTANAVRMQFMYDAAGEISQINTEYSNHAPSTTWFQFSQQGTKYKVVMYDTGHTDINKKIVYYTLNSEKYLEQDSTVYLNLGVDTGRVTSVNYIYDPNLDVVQSVQRSYTSGQLVNLDITASTRHPVTNPYETVRKKSYSTLANWFPFTRYFGNNLYSHLSFEQPRSLINSSVTDSYVYIFATPDHYQYEWQSTIELKDNRVIKRLSTYSSDVLDPWTINERFYYQ
jgi:hypothetical protein